MVCQVIILGTQSLHSGNLILSNITNGESTACVKVPSNHEVKELGQSHCYRLHMQSVWGLDKWMNPVEIIHPLSSLVGYFCHRPQKDYNGTSFPMGLPLSSSTISLLASLHSLMQHTRPGQLRDIGCSFLPEQFHHLLPVCEGSAWLSCSG